MLDRRRKKPLMSIIGRSMMVVLITLLGALGGLLVGVYRAMIQINALPPSPATMGFESAGIAPILLFGINLSLGAAVGAIVGLVIGVVGAILWPRQDAKSSSMLGPESLS